MQAFVETNYVDSAPGRFRRSPVYGEDRCPRWLATIGLVLILAVSFLPSTPCYSQDNTLDAAFAALAEYDWGTDGEAITPIESAIVDSRDDADMRNVLEERLAKVLQGDVSRAAKSYACRKLRQIGTSNSVPVLSELLGDEELGHMARSALEAIPGPEATTALREALAELKGSLRIGVVNSLGRRGDAESIPLLKRLVKAEETELAQAAVTALAAIDSSAAARVIVTLQDSAPAALNSTVANSCLQIAHRYLDAGQLDKAAAVLGRLEASDAEHVQWAALAGLIRAEPASAHGRLMKALWSDNARIRLAAGELVRDEAGDPLVKQLAESLSELPEEGQVCLLGALKQSQLAAVRTAALKALDSSTPELRAAAVRALVRSGRPEDVPVLIKNATDEDNEVRAAAQATLKALPGADINKALLDSLESAAAEEQVAIVRALVARKAPDLQEVLLQLATSPDESVRIEALRSLESLADAAHAEVLVGILVGTPKGHVREAAERAVWRSCSQIKDPSKSVEPILSQLREGDSDQQAALLPALGRVGGQRALEVVKKARNDTDKSVRDAAVRAICNWPDATVTEDLFQLARNAEKNSHRVWAMRGLARVLGRQGKDQPQEAFEGLRDVMQMATRLEDKQLVLQRLTAVRVPGSLELAVSLLEDPDLKLAAIDVTVDLGEGMKASHPKEARTALHKAALATEDPPLRSYIQKLLWNMQLKGN